MNKNWVLGGLLCVSMSVSAYNGNDLYRWGKDYQEPSGTFSSGMYSGYITGISDAFIGTAFCAPDGTTNGQLYDIVFNYLKENPARRTDDAGVIVLRSLSDAYPCKGKQ
ncbi:Rap1a/Tai family immunity protein [Klebsiella aerogenes]|uniref:Rap1a/Tai family immunity protein n=1 Tax=Klebsiella aerogenes TaxID=548 RepID=UPI002DB91168|nr:Rap1a/Tai family immunity protein [Klebsiella aerogenes]MEB5698433.1 hypothetical protein [Klebsiella aerogenes]HBV5676308.1 hypothetical protein [Klebsiella aerogenes]